MIIPQHIKQNYQYFEPYYYKVKEILDQTLISFCSKNLFAYTSRIKELNSLAEKIESGRFNDWDSIDDFVGAVIIVPNFNYEPQIIKFLETSLIKVQLKKRGSTLKSPDVFRFDATRFIGKLRIIENEEIINRINFEVQIRSAFEHAWSVTTHDLAYKSKTIDWKVLRLAAQLKSSVEQLDMLTLGAHEIKNSVQEHKWPETEIRIKICQSFEKYFIEKLIPEELYPKDMSRFSDNLFVLVRENLSRINQKKWNKEIESVLQKIKSNFEIFSQSDFPMSLSLYQLCYGILIKENIVSDDVLNNVPFLKSEVFEIIFPDSKNKRIKEFKINTVGNKVYML